MAYHKIGIADYDNYNTFYLQDKFNCTNYVFQYIPASHIIAYVPMFIKLLVVGCKHSSLLNVDTLFVVVITILQ